MNERTVNPRLVHDCGWACAMAVADAVGHLLREEERGDFVAVAYEAARAAIRAYEAEAERDRRRMNPGTRRGRENPRGGSADE